MLRLLLEMPSRVLCASHHGLDSKITVQRAYKSLGADHGEGAWAHILCYGVMNDIAGVMVESEAQ